MHLPQYYQHEQDIALIKSNDVTVIPQIDMRLDFLLDIRSLLSRGVFEAT
jgi:hypothetical protein